MKPLLLVAALLAVSTLLLWLPTLWRRHRQLAYIAILFEAAAFGVFVYVFPGWWSVVFTTIALYKMVNAIRLIRNRMHADYLRRVTLRTALLLSAAQVIIAGIAMVLTTPLALTVVLYSLVFSQLVVALLLFSSTQRHLKTTKTLQATKAYTDAELPTVSVLVPARNETDDLHVCLDALTSSDYPKLEIIVLDDSSQDKRTPEIIRSYAQAGVRFIAGQEPNDNWLAKNYAYQQLADAASGDYLLFCGVDLRMSPGAIRELITTMLEKQKSMLSILPQNARPDSFSSYLIQPVRYAWELSLPRKLFSRPPVLSTCWIIKRDSLLSSGSFKATSRSIVPESHFARATARQDGYSFLRSNMLVSSKPVAEQRATAIRMRYPQVHRRVELVWALTLLELLGVVLPLPLAVLLFVIGSGLAAFVALTAGLIGFIVYLQVTGVMYGRPVAWGVVMLPLATLYDVFLMNYSMYRYEFREVRWKERNICLPIMRFDVPATTSLRHPN